MKTIQKRDDYMLSGDGWVIDGPCMIAKRAMTLGDYQLQGENLKKAEGFVQFWIGDWAIQGKEEHGRGSMTELAEQIGWRPSFIYQLAYYSGQYETFFRKKVLEKYPELTHKHFVVVASLDNRIEWLERAGENGWKANQLYRKSSGQEDEWQPASFNIWQPFPIETWQQEYPGQIPGRILQNILHYTTRKGDLVIDPFAGGGNMERACKRMKRRCHSIDLVPQFKGIHRGNAVEPFPVSGAQLVFLDPPYWKQKQGDYATSPEDLSNRDLPDFYSDMRQVITNANNALVDSGYCVLIIGATQSNGRFHDHAAEIYADIRDDWQLINRIAAAYPTTQYQGKDMKIAKDHGLMLNLYTTILFLKKK